MHVISGQLASSSSRLAESLLHRPFRSNMIKAIAYHKVYSVMIQQPTINMTPASQPNAATAEGRPKTPAPIMAVTL